MNLDTVILICKDKRKVLCPCETWTQFNKGGTKVVCFESEEELGAVYLGLMKLRGDVPDPKAAQRLLSNIVENLRGQIVNMQNYLKTLESSLENMTQDPNETRRPK